MHKVTATIRKCGSKWCLYTKDGSRLLGKHDTKKGALKQEAAIHAHGHVVAMLDTIAQQLEARGEGDLAFVVDSATNELLEQRGDMLEETGFEHNVMQRDRDVAEEIYEQRIPQFDLNLQYQPF
jgi:hypothetical protein